MPEQKVGTVTHYFGHIQVAAIKLEGELAVGDTIRVKGHTTDLTQPIDSMQVNHANVPVGKVGDEIAVKVTDHVRQHDTVFKVTA